MALEGKIWPLITLFWAHFCEDEAFAIKNAFVEWIFLIEQEYKTT